MKKYLLGIVALALVALAVTLVVKAGDNKTENKKAETEMVKEAHECGAAHACGHEKGDKTACDPAKCKEKGCDPAKCGDGCCDHDNDKAHAQANCASQCPSAKKEAKHDHSKCNH